MKAQLKIVVGQRGEQTMLQNSFVTPPFKLANITEDKQHGSLHLMLMSSSPGVLDNDQYEIDIHVRKGARLRLESQSYQRLFPMRFGAWQRMNIEIETEASFIWLPHPVVPHKQSIFKTSNRINLQQDARLVWGEVITCGRIRENEIFQFNKYHSITQILVDGKLLIRENLLLQPAVFDVRCMGMMEGYTHQAGLIIVDSRRDIKALQETLFDWLGLQTGICFGISSVGTSGLIVRILGYKAEQLFDCLKNLAAMADQQQILPATLAAG